MNPRLAGREEHAQRKSSIAFFAVLSACVFFAVAVLGPDGPVRYKKAAFGPGSASIALGRSAIPKEASSSFWMDDDPPREEYDRINAYFNKFAVKRTLDDDERSTRTKNRRFSSAANLGGKTISAFGRYWDKQVPMDNVIRKNREGSNRVSAIMDAPESSSHASSLLALPNGDVLMAWFSGKAEGGDNVGIAVSKLKSGRRSGARRSL